MQFIDLKTQGKIIRSNILNSFERILDHGQYILGPEVYELEKELANFCSSKHVISCANGTDALILSLRAKGICHSDYVILPSFTYVATAGAASILGANIIFVDVCKDTFNIDPESLKRAIKKLKFESKKAKALICVDLFGQPADYDKITQICNENDIWILCDAAQSFGGTYKSKNVGQFGLLSTTSFFPAKPLGCYGDGGAIFTDDEELDKKLRSLRFHGNGKDRDETINVGLNSRLDTMQAAVLLEKLKLFKGELEKRNEIANQYHQVLKDYVVPPMIMPDTTSSWAQYTVQCKDANHRKKIKSNLEQAEIPSAIYYSKPIHKQKPYAHHMKADDLLNTEYLSEVVLSLPMSAYLDFCDSYKQKLITAFKS